MTLGFSKERALRKEVALTQRAVPWSSDIKWGDLLIVDGRSYTPPCLFPSKAWNLRKEGVVASTAPYMVESKTGQFRYVNNLLSRGEELSTWRGGTLGFVVFNSDVIIPTLYERPTGGWASFSLRYDGPWMSFTPAEFLSLRAGVRLAKKHTVVAGLGLGWQLAEVLKKKTVKQVTLVERSQELIDLVLPTVLASFVSAKDAEKLRVEVGDARAVVPKMTADVALIDIFEHYGNNEFDRCPNIGRVWVWGSAPTPGSIFANAYTRQVRY